MLGIRLPPDAEERLIRHARSLGRGKSVVARDWILERLDRENIDEEMRLQAIAIAAQTSSKELAERNTLTDNFLRMLDEEDGGYDWGPEGPPA